MLGAGGRTDGHIGAHTGGSGEQAGGVSAVELLGGQIALVVPFVEHLDEGAVLLIVEQIVLAGGAGIGRVILFAHGDEPVGLAVIAQRDGFGVDLLDLGADLLHFLPGGGHGDTVGLEEGLVIVQHFSGLGEGHGVHQSIPVLTAFLVVALDEVGLLLVGQAQNFGGAVGAGHFHLAVDQLIEGLHGLGQVVQGHVVGIAVRHVGLRAHADVGHDLVAHVIVAALRGMFHMNVGIELVELRNVIGGHFLQRGALLGAEGDGHFAAVVAFRRHFEASGESRAAQHHQNQKNGEQFFHLVFPSFSFMMFLFM